MTAPRRSADIPTVTYYLVLLRPGENHNQAEQHYQAHVEFIMTLETAGSVLLGGSFEAPLDGAEGAYLLHASTRADAEELAKRDPLVNTRAFRAEIIEWNLVGVCRKAIDPSFSDEA